MNKLYALFDLFKKGSSVLEPEKWKNRQITVTVLAGLVLAVVNTLAAFGYSIPIDIDSANAISAGIIAVVNVVLTVTTSDKVGINSENSNSVKEEVKEDFINPLDKLNNP